VSVLFVLLILPVLLGALTGAAIAVIAETRERARDDRLAPPNQPIDRMTRRESRLPH
jgi:hypothetical protein